MGLTKDGAFAERISLRADYCWKLNGIAERFERRDAYRVGTLIEPIGCAYNGIFISGGGVVPGEYAVVYGAGPIGLGAVLLLRLAGAAKIIVVDVVDERLAIARQLGADHTINFMLDQQVPETIRGLTNGWGADIQVEAAGARPTVAIMQRVCAKRGRIIYLGRAEASTPLELNSMVSGAVRLVGSRGHSGYGIYPSIIRLLQAGRLDNAKHIITSVFPFSRIHDAFKATSSRKDGKILIEMR
jgi:threonine dehydrogenase-like Zn-dependent dehydrogenase